MTFSTFVEINEAKRCIPMSPIELLVSFIGKNIFEFIFLNLPNVNFELTYFFIFKIV